MCNAAILKVIPIIGNCNTDELRVEVKYCASVGFSPNLYIFLYFVFKEQFFRLSEALSKFGHWLLFQSSLVHSMYLAIFRGMYFFIC